MESHWTCYFGNYFDTCSVCVCVRCASWSWRRDSQSSKPNEIPSGSFLCDGQRWKFKKKHGIMITRKISQYMNLYECPKHVVLSTPCLIILVTINAMDIVWYYGVGGCPNGRTDPEYPVHVDSPTLINHSDPIWGHARGPKQIETVYHGPTAPFPWTCSAWDGAFGLQQCCSQLCKNLAVHAGSSSRSCARTRVRNHGCSIPRRNTGQHNEVK